MVSTPEVFKRQKIAEKTANKLFKMVEQKAVESDKAWSHLPIVTKAMARVYNCLRLWLYEGYPDEILWLYQHGSIPCLQHVWMFNDDVNTAIALLKDKGKAALAADIEGRWLNIMQKAPKTDGILSELRERYDRDEDNPAYANDVKSALCDIKADVSQLAKNLFDVAKQQASEAKTELERIGKAGDMNKPPEDVGQGETDDIKSRFTFNEAQAFFDGKDLGLPSGDTVSILKRLVDSFEEVVKHNELDQNSNPSNASDILKGRIYTIKKSLKRHKIPYKIEPKRGIGYVLQ